MLIKLEVDTELYERIEKLVKEGKYSDLYQFVKIAINNQLLEEKTEVQEDKEPTPTQSIKFQINKTLQDIYRRLSDVQLEKSELPLITPPLIWSFYNRFFPVKIVVRQLASMVIDKKWRKLSEVQDESFTYAEAISDSLKAYETEHDIPRNEKLSTGLPSPASDLKGLRGFKKKKKEEKLVASKIRFQDHFVGHYIKKDGIFKGACFEMGLMGVKIEDDECFVSLTDLGRDFALMENPILDQEDFNKPFSDDEVSFIFLDIIQKFRLEKTIVDRILNELKNKSLISEQIDEIFNDEKIKYYKLSKSEVNSKKLFDTTVSERVATMGRLSELWFVDWKIDNKGKSIYSLKKK